MEIVSFRCYRGIFTPIKIKVSFLLNVRHADLSYFCLPHSQGKGKLEADIRKRIRSYISGLPWNEIQPAYAWDEEYPPQISPLENHCTTLFIPF